jgi:hypothetical protein
VNRSRIEIVLPSGLKHGVVDSHARAVGPDAAMLEDGIESITHLAGVDGAILMDYAFR